MTLPNHLILVCCHATYLTSSGSSKGVKETEWLLSPFQSGEIPTLTSHIKTGLSLFSSDPHSLLIFSGSKTRKETSTSEGQSYLDLCTDNAFWGILKEGERGRVLVEEQALDSFGNLMFGVLRFWKEAGAWPKKISIVSQGFKRDRFLGLHVPAIRFPVWKVDFLGAVPPFMEVGEEQYDGVRTAAVLEGERERGVKLWEVDMLGTGEVLKKKRKDRNSWGVSQMWFGSEEEKGRSGVRSRVVKWEGMTEEVLGEERQPWEVEV